MNKQSPCRIVLADDHDLILFALQNLLSAEPDLEVVALSRSGQELLTTLKEKECDLLVLDLGMPDLNGLEVLPRIRVRFPHMKILVLTAHADVQIFQKAIKQGIDGYLLKPEKISTCIEAIKSIRNDQKFFSSELGDAYFSELSRKEQFHTKLCILTNREREIFQLVIDMNSDQEIAQNLNISSYTARNHRRNILRKLGAKCNRDLFKMFS